MNRRQTKSPLETRQSERKTRQEDRQRQSEEGEDGRVKGRNELKAKDDRN